MTEPTLKPLGRCECRNCDECTPVSYGEFCQRNAVRMVTVPPPSNKYSGLYESREVPMCEPCAAFHTQKAGVK